MTPKRQAEIETITEWAIQSAMSQKETVTVRLFSLVATAEFNEDTMAVTDVCVEAWKPGP